MAQYILAIDQGTTSTRAVIFTHEGRSVATHQQEFAQFFPQEGWVEHDPLEIWQSVLSVVRGALAFAKLTAKDILTLGITNQRETTVVWNRNTGKPVYPAIVWQDRRTARHCDQLKQRAIDGKDANQVIRGKTGLLLDPYFSATKIQWILDQVPGAADLAQKGALCAGTIDSWLIWNLTNGENHVTDATNAGRTNLFNIHTQAWDESLCHFFRVPTSVLPKVLNCADDFGTSHSDHFGAPIPIQGVAGDQHAALIGQACFAPGMSKCTFGTGCFLVLNTGQIPVQSDHGLITTLAYRLKGMPTYAMEGSAFIAGAVVQWLRDGLGLIQSASDSEAMAVGLSQETSCVFVPAFTGLGAPYWDPHARATLFGMTRDTKPADIAAAALQSVCFQTVDLVDAMRKDGAVFKGLRVDGGMTANNYAMQYLSNLLQTSVMRPAYTETTVLGAAYLAGLQAGVFGSLDDIHELWEKERQFEVKATNAWSIDRYKTWQKAVNACRLFTAEGQG